MVSCLLITSKLILEDHLDANLCLNHIFKGRYSLRQLVETESKVAFDLEMDLECPTMAHYINFYFSLLKLRIQEWAVYIGSRQMKNFLNNCEDLAMSFVGLVLLDRNLFAGKMSLISFSIVLMSLQRLEHTYQGCTADL